MRAAAAWLADFRGQPGFEHAVAAIAERLAVADPAAARRLASEHIADPRTRADLLRRLPADDAP